MPVKNSHLPRQASRPALIHVFEMKLVDEVEAETPSAQALEPEEPRPSLVSMVERRWKLSDGHTH